MTPTKLTDTDLASLAGSWTLDTERSSVEFHTKAMWIVPVKGTARTLEGSGTFGLDGSLSGTLAIDASSIDTKNKKRDDHLRTADFFEVVTYPTITYTATGGHPLATGGYEVTGSLTIHGTSRPVTLIAEVSATQDTAAVTSTVNIDRSEWGLLLTPFGAGVKNKVVLNLHFNKG